MAIKKTLLIAAILNGIAGCIAGTLLVMANNNSLYYIINIITGATSGICFANLGADE